MTLEPYVSSEASHVFDRIKQKFHANKRGSSTPVQTKNNLKSNDFKQLTT